MKRSKSTSVVGSFKKTRMRLAVIETKEKNARSIAALEELEESSDEESVLLNLADLADYEGDIFNPWPDGIMSMGFDNDDVWESSSDGDLLSVASLDQGLLASADFSNYANHLRLVPSLEGNRLSFEEYFVHLSSCNFDLKSLIMKSRLRSVGMNRLQGTYDAEEFVFPGIDSSMTKQQFAEAVKSFVDIELIPVQTADRLLGLLWNMMPFCNFPGVEDAALSFTGSFKRLVRYCEVKDSGFAFHQCPVGECCVFVGDNSLLNECPKCKSCRYTPCKRCVYASNTGRYDESACKHNDRTPIKVIHYRGILNIVKSLLQQDLFLSYINYHYCHGPNERSGEPREEAREYCDILDGETAKMNLLQMREIFMQAKQKGRGDLVEVSLLLAHFYDGVQLFKNKVVNFWPLLIQILNLPPTMRSRAGVGIFTLGLFSGRIGSEADDFLLGECFVQELHLLCTGVCVSVGDVQYFVQVRIIAHQMDTKGFEKVMSCQTATSLVGCPLCKTCCGRTHPGFGGGIYFIGHRINLPVDHKLRVFGSGKEKHCTSFTGSFNVRPLSKTEKEVESEEFNRFDADNWREVNRGLDVRRVQPKFPNYKQLLIDGCAEVGPNSCYFKSDIILNDVSWYGLWYHKDDFGFEIQALHRDLYYSKCELREQIVHVRKTNSWYISCGEEAAVQSAEMNRGRSVNAATSSMKTHGVSYKHKNKKKAVVSGVSGCWFAKTLPYAQFEDTYWCTMHVLKNVFGSLRSSLTGYKTNQRKNVYFDYCRMTHMHPGVWNQKGTTLPPWQIDVMCQNVADAFLSAMLLPNGYGNSIQAKEVFRNPERTNSHACKMLLLVVLPYLLDRTRLAGSYKVFVWMLSSDLVDLFRPYHCSKSINVLHDKILETVAVHDGMFPPFDCTFAWHQLTDIPKMIKQLGCLEGWSGFWGERFLGFMKKQCPEGGTSFDKTIMDRMHRVEMARMRVAYNGNQEGNASATLSSLLQGSSYTRIDRHGQATFSLYRLEVTKKTSKESDGLLNTFERNLLLTECFIPEIVRSSKYDDVSALQHSPLYRLYTSFHIHLKKLHQRDKLRASFDRFLQDLYYGNYSMLSLDLKEFVLDVAPVVDWVPYCDAGNIYTRDVMNTGMSLFSEELLHRTYSKLTSYGVRFSARGFVYREMEADFNKVNPLSTLNLFWSQKRNYSSWCRYRRFNPECEKDLTIQYMAQINSFHIVCLPTETAIHRLTIASVTSRKHTYEKDSSSGLINKYASIDLRDCDTNFNKCPRFVFCKYIIPTAIAVVGIVEEGSTLKPWASLEKVRKHGEATSCYSSDSPENASYLHLLDLHPYNCQITMY